MRRHPVRIRILSHNAADAVFSNDIHFHDQLCYDTTTLLLRHSLYSLFRREVSSELSEG